MSREQRPARAIVERWGRLWSTGDSAKASEVFAPDVVDHRPPPARDIRGIAGETRWITRVRAAFPDLRLEIAETVAEGDRIAARVMHRGTHRGEFFGLAPSGRSVAYEGTVIFRIVDDKIAERWGTVDLFAILWQLGLPSTLPIAGGLGVAAT